MAAKKDTNQYPGCLGTTCTDGTCLACQVSQSERHHEDVIAAIKDLGAHVGDVATELTSLRGKLTGTGPKAELGRTPPVAVPVAPPVAVPVAPPVAVPVAPPVAVPVAPPKALTVDAVRPAILEWVKANGRDKLIAVLTEFGAAKLPDVKDVDLPKLVDRLGIKV